MSIHDHRSSAFTLIEVLLVTVIVGLVSGLALVAVQGARDNARETRLRNDVAVLNNGIDAYRAAGGVIAGASASNASAIIAKLKTVAATDSTALGPKGPFIDPRLQISMQSTEEGNKPEARADYPDAAGYFYMRQGGAVGIKEFVRGEASPVVTETRQGSMPYTPGGEFLAAYDEQPAVTPVSAAAPVSVAGQDESAQTGRDLVKFPRPLVRIRKSGSTNSFVEHGGGSLDNTRYYLDVEISSPLSMPTAGNLSYTLTDRKGQIQYFSSNSSSPVILSGVDYGARLTAKVISKDATRYSESDPREVTFAVIPTAATLVSPFGDIPSSVDYATALSNVEAVVKLDNIENLAPQYRTSAYLQAFYRTTNYQRYTGAVSVTTNAGFSAPTFTPVTNIINVAWFGLNSSVTVSASVESYEPLLIRADSNFTKTVSIATTPLAVNIFPLKPIGLPPSVTITNVGDRPANGRIFYTLTTGSSGAAPLNPVSGGTNIATATNYTATGPITNYPIATYTVVAQATGPTNTEHWFTCTAKSNTYIAITTVPLSYIGLNMYRANINGLVKGSIYMQAGDFAILNAGAVIQGNVYVPGLPSVTLPGTGGTVVGKGRTYNQSTDATISTNRITGREYTREGTLADPQSDLRKIVDVYGAVTPDNYDFRVNSSARIDGKVYRRADPPPVTSQKPGLPSGIALSNAAVNVTGTLPLGAGSYAVTMTNTNAVLRLGTAGTLTSYVFGAGSSWSAGRVEILGPVQIYLNSATAFNGVTFGSSNSIYQTGFVVMSNYSVTIDNNAAVYGQFEARDSAISIGSGGGQTIRGTLVGSAFANTINVDGSGFVDVSGGSGTNSATNTTTP